MKDFIKSLSGTKFFPTSEPELSVDVCKSITEYKTRGTDEKIINNWLATTKNKNAVDKEGNAAVHLAIIHRHPQLALWLLKNGLDINVINKKLCENSLTLAIYEAAKQKQDTALRKDYIKLIQYLLENNAEMEIKVGFGSFKYALCVAAGCCDLPVIKLLIEHGADINYTKDMYSPLGFATSAVDSPEREAVLSYLQSKGAQRSGMSLI